MKYYFKCPGCGSDEQFIKPAESGAEPGVLTTFFGGAMTSYSLAEARRNRVQCGKCGRLFKLPPIPNSPVARLAHWIIMSLILFFLAGGSLLLVKSGESYLPKVQWISEFSCIIADHPYLVAFWIVSLTVFLLLTSMLAALISNIRFTTRFQKQYKTRPESFRAVMREERAERTSMTTNTSRPPDLPDESNSSQ